MRGEDPERGPCAVADPGVERGADARTIERESAQGEHAFAQVPLLLREACDDACRIYARTRYERRRRLHACADGRLGHPQEESTREVRAVWTVGAESALSQIVGRSFDDRQVARRREDQVLEMFRDRPAARDSASSQSFGRQPVDEASERIVVRVELGHDPAQG